MALPPRQRQWNIEPDADADWFADGLPEMQSFISAVTYALTQQLSRADNFRSQKRTLQLDTTNTNFPLDFQCTLGAIPEEIRVIQARVITTGGAFSGPVTATNWELRDGSTIRLHDITGLAANTKYEVTIVVE